MAKANDFKELKVWQEGKNLAVQVYEITKAFPSNEQFGLSPQMQRAAILIPSNIAEGFGCEGDKEFKHFLMIARGSAAELETQLIITKELGYIDEGACSDLVYLTIQVQKMPNGLIGHIRSSNS